MNNYIGRIIVMSFIAMALSSFSILTLDSTNQAEAQKFQLARGQKLPNVALMGKNQQPVHLDELQGRVKIVSIVPQLNTPVCDEQTHRFSETNQGLDQHLDIITISTNTSGDQRLFADKADIHNVVFLSDTPNYDFGRTTGLLHPMHLILQRAVIIADSDNVIRYIEEVPMSQLPNFDRAFETARNILKHENP